MKQLIAYATILSGKNTSWEEDFEVSSKETAEEEIKDVIKYFNDTLKPGESLRSFKDIVRFEEKEIKDDDEDNVDEWDDSENEWDNY